MPPELTERAMIQYHNFGKIGQEILKAFWGEKGAERFKVTEFLLGGVGSVPMLIVEEKGKDPVTIDFQEKNQATLLRVKGNKYCLSFAETSAGPVTFEVINEEPSLKRDSNIFAVRVSKNRLEMVEMAENASETGEYGVVVIPRGTELLVYSLKDVLELQYEGISSVEGAYANEDALRESVEYGSTLLAEFLYKPKPKV